MRRMLQGGMAVCSAVLFAGAVLAAEDTAPPASSASAETAAAVPVAPAVPFVGKVTGSQVNVRAGANPNFEIVHRVQRGESLIVVGQTSDWYAVELPPEASCFVAAKFVTREDADAGSVTGANVNLRGGPATKYNALGKIFAGERVRILEERDGWLRIVPPASARGWIARSYVQPDPSGQVEIVRTAYHTRGAGLGASAPSAQVAGPAPAGSLPTLLVVAQGRLERAHGLFWKRPTGTHQLVRDRNIVAYVTSDTITLDDYLHQEVSVWGQVSVPSGKTPHVAVTRIANTAAPTVLPATSAE